NRTDMAAAEYYATAHELAGTHPPHVYSPQTQPPPPQYQQPYAQRPPQYNTAPQQQQQQQIQTYPPHPHNVHPTPPYPIDPPPYFAPPPQSNTPLGAPCTPTEAAPNPARSLCRPRLGPLALRLSFRQRQRVVLAATPASTPQQQSRSNPRPTPRTQRPRHLPRRRRGCARRRCDFPGPGDGGGDFVGGLGRAQVCQALEV
ncbi:hypothetical protein JI435_012590, partial [Parastagonospora nodorum SN15]